MTGELTLLNPGPAGTSGLVRQAMLRGDLCHREPEFSELQERIRTALPRALNLGATHVTILVTGSGTAAMEMAVIGAVRESGRLLVVRNGVYGDRIAQVAAAHAIDTVILDGSWTRPAEPDQVRDMLRRDPRIEAVACVQHETTTGLINPVEAIGQAAREQGTVFVVDAISATAIENPDLAAVGGDLVCGTANKGLHAIPGISFLLASPAGVDRIRSVPRRSLYLDPLTHLAAQNAGTVPFTPAVQACYALDEALREFVVAGGYPNRLEAYRERAALVRAGFARLDLEILIDEPWRANSVTMLKLPPGIAYQALHDCMRTHGYVIYAGQSKFAEGYFRIATMGEIPAHRLEGIEPALSESVSTLTHR
jgi:2-aminoethylphosphonate-pyruvate transaminase